MQSVRIHGFSISFLRGDNVLMSHAVNKMWKIIVPQWFYLYKMYIVKQFKLQWLKEVNWFSDLLFPVYGKEWKKGSWILFSSSHWQDMRQWAWIKNPEIPSEYKKTLSYYEDVQTQAQFA